jgi:DNA-directed RNA polymerase subunit H
MGKENFINQHELVPKHSKLGEKATKELLKKHNASKDQLPKILLKDPALLNLEVKSGDVIKIERKSPTAEKATYYRIVTED